MYICRSYCWSLSLLCSYYFITSINDTSHELLSFFSVGPHWLSIASIRVTIVRFSARFASVLQLDDSLSSSRFLHLCVHGRQRSTYVCSMFTFLWDCATSWTREHHSSSLWTQTYVRNGAGQRCVLSKDHMCRLSYAFLQVPFFVLLLFSFFSARVLSLSIYLF